MVGDSVVGEANAARVGDPDRRIAIPLSEVTQVRTRNFEEGKTFALVFGVLGGAALILIGLFLLTNEDNS